LSISSASFNSIYLLRYFIFTEIQVKITAFSMIFDNTPQQSTAEAPLPPETSHGAQPAAKLFRNRQIDFAA